MLKKIILSAITLLIVFGSVNLGGVSAASKKKTEDNVYEFTVDEYDYTLTFNGDFGYATIHNNLDGTEDTVNYHKGDDYVTFNGEKVATYAGIEEEHQAETFDLIQDSQLYAASSITSYGPYTVTFESIFTTAGAVAAAVVLINAVYIAVTTAAVAVADFTKTLTKMIAAYDYGKFGKDFVYGYFRYYMEYDAGTNLWRYNMRYVCLTEKDGTPKKAISFGPSGWWSNTRPY